MLVLRDARNLVNRGELMLSDAVMRRLRAHMSPEKLLQLAGVMDAGD